MKKSPTIKHLIEKVREYMPDEDLSPLEKAHAFAQEIYLGKHRLSGKPYLAHALSVAFILATMQLDLQTLIAGLLHGALKETTPPISEAQLNKKFGETVTSIVKGSTKIANVQFNNQIAYQAENIRKMLLAMSSDIRVLLVKLADRLHDMQSLKYVHREKQKEFAEETMDLYAPLASRLGVDWIKRELEDLSFSYMHPEEYADLRDRIKSSMQDRQTYVDEVKQLLTTKLTNYGLKNFEILGRPKHLFSIYKKLIAQNIPLEKVYDKVAFRIILNTVKECYEALGVVHALWVPVDGRFKDFISSPKGNMYQSLHTSVIGPYGEFMEVQIRTQEMDKIAREGIAAHWAYKEGKAITQKDAKLFQWLKQLVHSIQELHDPQELIDAVKGELYEAEVFVLTPNGEVKELPLGSTPVDFAYSIHTEVGDHCVGAKINGHIAQLKTPLKNGDVVEVITSAHQRPNRGWLTLVKTGRARSRIRQWLRAEEQEKSLQVGKEICERELKRHDINLKKIIKTGHLKEILKSISCNSLDELMRRVGSGKITIKTLIKKMQPPEAHEPEPLPVEAITNKVRKQPDQGSIIKIDGVNNVLTKISNCCMPIPGDEIMGFITAGRGISVHKANCPNLASTNPDRWIYVKWAESVKTSLRAQIHVVAQDKKGFLGTLSNVISSDDANILNIEANTTSGKLARINIILEVTDLNHLLTLLQHIQQLEEVIEASRR